MAKQFSFLFALSSSILLEPALAATDYAVYYNPSTTSYNPLGSGYRPDSPSNWNNVDDGTWPIFLDWGNYLEDTSDWNNGNECEDRSSSSYSTSHKQSPLKLRADRTCNDRHKMIIVDRGQCQKSQAKFYTTPYGLGVDVTGCSKPFVLDHSLNEDEWYMEEIVLKVPAEHSIIDPSTGTERTFVGELQLGFRGSNDGYDPSNSHKKNIAIVGVLLEVGTSSQADLELEKLIQGWESYASQKYSSCGKTYDHTNCRLQSGRLRRELEQDETPASSFPVEPEEQRNLISSSWDKTCPSSYFCFINLYLHTETDYYYNYLGSLTYPPCTENVYWRVMQQTMKISPGQLQRLQRLTYMHLDGNCKLATVGKQRGTSSCPCCVGVNRPRQALSKSHKLKKCDQWSTQSLGDTTNSTTTTMSVQNGLF